MYFVLEHKTEADAESKNDNFEDIPNKLKFHCTLCDKAFAHKNSLLYHMRGHTGNRPHQCEHCGKSFFSSSALKIHLRMHSGINH